MVPELRKERDSRRCLHGAQGLGLTEPRERRGGDGSRTKPRRGGERRELVASELEEERRGGLVVVRSRLRHERWVRRWLWGGLTMSGADERDMGLTW